MQWDLNYLLYSALLIDHQNKPDKIAKYIESSNINLSLIIIKDDSVLFKYPQSFFSLPNADYATISKFKDHPYQSESDFQALSGALSVEPDLPSSIKEASFGVWEDGYYADYIESKDGYKYYIITNNEIEDSVGIGNDGSFVFTWGLIIGVLFILVFVALTYNYIRIRLRPIQLMKRRLQDLERGDLESKIKIMGTDELAELSVSFNRLISEIKDLIDKKHRLLLDVSHELKSPLARMLLLIEMIPPENKQTEELKEEIQFLNDMISNLLLTDKLDVPYSQLTIESINHLDFLNKIVAFFNQDQQQKINIMTNLDHSCAFFIDETKMIICIKNILQNAFKYAYTERGVDINVKQKGDCYYIGIQDYGPGIKDQDREHVFESFYRSKSTSSVSGFGLGLAISKKMIEAHNGSIDINTDLNCGTEFILIVPVGGHDK